MEYVRTNQATANYFKTIIVLISQLTFLEAL